MNHLGQITIFNRPVYFASVPDFVSLSDIELPSSSSVILLLADANGVDSEPICSAASRLIEQGAIYVCAWGADCERVHDIFDEVDVGDGTSDKDQFIMTTWHADDSLDEAVDFFLTCAFPLDQPLDTCSWIAIEIGDPASPSFVEETIKRAIAAPQ